MLQKNLIDFLNQTITTGKLLELETCPQNLCGGFAQIIGDLLRRFMGGKQGELFRCCNCGAAAIRVRGRSNPKQYCDAEKCQKVKKIKNTVAKFSALPAPRMSTTRADSQYHGGYHE